MMLIDGVVAVEQAGGGDEPDRVHGRHGACDSGDTAIAASSFASDNCRTSYYLTRASAPGSTRAASPRLGPYQVSSRPRHEHGRRGERLGPVVGGERVGLVGQHDEVVRRQRGRVDPRVALGVAGEHVVDAEPGEHGAGEGVAADRHPRPPPDRHHRPRRPARPAAARPAASAVGQPGRGVEPAGGEHPVAARRTRRRGCGCR